MDEELSQSDDYINSQFVSLYHGMCPPGSRGESQGGQEIWRCVSVSKERGNGYKEMSEGGCINPRKTGGEGIFVIFSRFLSLFENSIFCSNTPGAAG